MTSLNTESGHPIEASERSSGPIGKLFAGLLLLLMSIMAAPLIASATEVVFEAEDLPDPGSEDVWRYRYKPTGLELQADQGLVLLFDSDAYGELSAPAASDESDWSAIAIQPDPLLPDEGSLDLRALVAQPATDGTFEIDFEWTGEGAPGPQPFVVYDDQFQPLEVGQTVPVPEPGGTLAAGTALAVLAWLRRRRAGPATARTVLAAGCVAAAAWGTPASAAEPVVHEVDTGDYRIEYWLADSQRVTRTVTDFRFATRIISEVGAGVPRVVALAASGSPSTLVEDDLVVFGDVGPGQEVESVDTFTLRQDRTVPFDPADIDFTVQVDSDYPCAALSLGASSGVIGEKIPIFGLQGVDENTGFRAIGPSTSFFVPVGQEPDGSYFLITPIHPDFAGEAGTISVALETAGAVCPLGDIALPALPAADADDADEILALAEQAVTAMLAAFGFDPASFVPGDPTNSALDLSLALTWRALLYEDSPTSISTQRANLAALSESERILIGRMLAEAGVQDQLNAMLLRYEGQEPMLPGPATTTTLLSAAAAAATAARPPPGDSSADAAAGISGGGCLTLDVEKVPILTAGELSLAMQNAESAAASLASQNLRRKLGGALFASAVVAGPAGAVVSDVTGSILLAQINGDQNPAKLLPSRIVSTRMEATLNPINEDYREFDDVERPRWRAFTTAESEGLDLRLDVGLLIFQALTLAPLTAAESVPLSNFDTASEFVFDEDPPEDSCFRVPPHTWTDINVSERQWLEEDPTESGPSIMLVDTIEMEPVGIGVTTIGVQLSSSLFPCEGCTLGAISADLDVEVLEKKIVFARSRYAIGSSSGAVTVTGSIQNSSYPEFYDVFLSSGGVITNESPPDPQFSFTVQGLGNDEDFPLGLAVQSASRTLPAGTPPRAGGTQIVLDPEIVVTLFEEECVAPGNVAPLDADVIGFTDPTVTWSQPPGTTVNPVNATQAEFSAAQPGSYTVTATSVVDSMVQGSLDIVVGNCDVELRLYALGYGYVDTGKQANPPCGTGIDTGPIEVQEEYGTRPEGANLRTDLDWTAGGELELDIMLDEVANVTTQPVDTCYSATFLTSATAAGTLMGQSVGQQQDLDVDLTVGDSGGCEEFEPGLVECQFGLARLDVVASFVFEHDGEAPQAYDYTANMVCSLIEPVLGNNNVRAGIGLVDENGNTFSASEVLDQQSLLAFVRANTGKCFSGEPLSIQETFVFQKLLPEGADPSDPGTPYTGSIRVTLDLDPVAETETEVYSNTGTMDGIISVRPVQVPTE